MKIRDVLIRLFLALSWRRSARSTALAGIVVIGSLFASAIMIQPTSAALERKNIELNALDTYDKQLREQSTTLRHNRAELEHYNQKLERSLGEKAKRQASLREENEMLLQSILAFTDNETYIAMKVEEESKIQGSDLPIDDSAPKNSK